MHKKYSGAPLRALLTAALFFCCFVPTTEANSNGGFTTLVVNGEPVKIYRDEFGVPHIFARTNRGLFEAYGYAVAQDRLWQLELNRRASRGRLAEIFGAPALNSDLFIRTTGYTDAELDAQFASLTAEEQEIFDAYAGGINRYLSEVVAADPSKLPFEFYALGFSPAPWTVRDSVAFGVFMVRRFGEIGGREGFNQLVLSDLVAAHGPVAGYGVFNDLRWLDDPEAPVTVPTSGAIGKRQKSHDSLNPAQQQNLTGAAGASKQGASKTSAPKKAAPNQDEALKYWESIGVPTRLGSYAWAVSPAKSANGNAMLYGGPQMGFSAPEVLHDVQLNGGRGFNVTGMAFAGVPAVLIGHNENIAWTSTTATGDNLDHYVETLCDFAGPNTGYIHNGGCLPLEVRVETINVAGGAPVALPVARTLHGPVVTEPIPVPGGAVVLSQKRAHWQREMESVHAFIGFDRARDLKRFEEAVEQIPTSHNFIYADQKGNIAYWQAGQVPLRPAGFDPRLPLPGDGSAEWPGGLLPIPKSINPRQGYLANWNNKPSVGYDNADNLILGKQNRLRDITDRLASGRISLADMRDIPKDIARVKGLGREARFLRPHLLAALNAVPPTHPLAPQARAVVEAWDGNAFADAVTSTNLNAGEVIFFAWLERAMVNTFSDELGARLGEATPNTLLHSLDFALAGESGVPPSRDYFNGVGAHAVMSNSFDQAVAAIAAVQGGNPAAWTAPRGSIVFAHPIVGVVGSVPNSNRATYAQIVVLDKHGISGENIFTLGQSGFIQFVPPGGFALDPHFKDLLPLYRNFQYKPMRLYKDDKLKK